MKNSLYIQTLFWTNWFLLRLIILMASQMLHSCSIFIFSSTINIARKRPHAVMPFLKYYIYLKIACLDNISTYWQTTIAGMDFGRNEFSSCINVKKWCKLFGNNWPLFQFMYWTISIEVFFYNIIFLVFGLNFSKFNYTNPIGHKVQIDYLKYFTYICCVVCYFYVCCGIHRLTLLRPQFTQCL